MGLISAGWEDGVSLSYRPATGASDTPVWEEHLRRPNGDPGTAPWESRQDVDWVTRLAGKANQKPVTAPMLMGDISGPRWGEAGYGSEGHVMR
jgi:hypothetical protein